MIATGAGSSVGQSSGLIISAAGHRVYGSTKAISKDSSCPLGAFELPQLGPALSRGTSRGALEVCKAVYPGPMRWRLSSDQGENRLVKAFCGFAPNRSRPLNTAVKGVSLARGLARARGVRDLPAGLTPYLAADIRPRGCRQQGQLCWCG